MGYLFVILASILFGSYPSIQEHVMTTGATPLGMVIVCNSVAGLSSLIIGLIRRESFKLDKKMFGSLALTGILGLFLTDYLLNTSYTMIPVGFTTMIHFLYPSLVCMTMVFVYKEKLTKGKVGAIVLSIVGLILLSGGDISGDKRGVFVAIATAFAYGFYMISNDKSSVAKVPLMARSFYLNLFVAIAALITNIFTKSAVLPSGAENIELSVLVGIMLCTALILMNAGIGILGAGKSSFINMLEPITSFVVSTIVFHYSITVTAILGSVLILGSLILVTLGEEKKQTVN